MLEEIKNVIKNPLVDYNWLLWTIGLLMIVIIILLVYMVSQYMIWIIDSSFLEIKINKGVILRKYYENPYTYTSFIMCGKTMIPMTHYVDGRYMISIEIDDIKQDIEVTQDNYDILEVGDSLSCKYTNGRILKSIYIKSWQFIT